jgi:RNA polymerase sigma-70 factor (ECF subfamily)
MEVGLRELRAAAAGDATAFTRIVATYHREMARVAFVITGDADDAQDAVQAAWAIAWRQLGSHREDASLRAWLLKIAANEARQSIRRDQRRALREVPVDSLGAEPSAVPGWDSGAHLDLAGSLARLSADDRALLALRFAADLDSTEIARIIGGTPSGVRSRLSRLLHRLREDLDHA